MAAVNSTMQSLGSRAPDFKLPNTNANSTLVNRLDYIGKPLLVMFICNHCPYVIHIIERLVELSNEAADNGFAVAAINSNDVDKYPQDGPIPMTSFAENTGMKFAYLFDETQEVAKAYGAACTPDFFVYDAEHRLQYRGQMDGARPNNSIAVSGDDLIHAVNAIINGHPIQEKQVPSIGCSIKWKAGNEPDYF